MSPDSCYALDISLLEQARSRGSLPSFSQGKLDHLRVPFVDITDLNQNIQSIQMDASNETEKLVLDKINKGKFCYST